MSSSPTFGYVSGTVWNDQNGNGKRDSGEEGLAGWVVFADANGNGKLDSGEAKATTTWSGSYWLKVKPGTYAIREVVAKGWKETTPKGIAYSVTVKAWNTLTGKSFGNRRALATISGTVFNDLNGNGIKDKGEQGLSGWIVFADQNGNGTRDASEPWAATGSDGSYRLTVSASATQTIRESLQNGWDETAPSLGSYSMAIAVGGTKANVNFGNRRPQPIQPPQPAGSDFHIRLSDAGLTASEETAAVQAAVRWEKVVVGALPAVKYNGQTIDGILINIHTQSLDGSGGVLAEGGPDDVRADDGLPYVATIVVDSADITSLQDQGTLLDVLTHEMGHCLGFGTLWGNKGLTDASNRSAPVFTGAQAVAEYDAIFHTNATGVPLEAGGGSGTALAHWSESVFRSELMVGYIQPGGMPLSRITLASLADLGYQVNLAAADLYSPSASSVSHTSLVSMPASPAISPTPAVRRQASYSNAPSEDSAAAQVWQLWDSRPLARSSRLSPGEPSLRHPKRLDALAALNHVLKTTGAWLEV